VSEQEPSPATAQAEAVEELLRQLVDARFVLTDRDGGVTRWSRPAEELFGWPSSRMLGRTLVDTLALTGDLPEFGGTVQTVARRKDGSELELTLTFIPVGMSQSLEFNGFLEALEIAAPRGNALRQLQRSHKTVVDWVSAAMGGHAKLDEDDLAAGTIVAFRPLIELPPAPLPPKEDEGHDPTATAAGQIADAVEAALGRSDDLERALEGTTAELVEARGEAEAARGDIAKAVARIEELGTQLADTRRVLEEMRAQSEEERERTGATVEEARALAERLERELAGTPQAQQHLSAQLEETRANLGELLATREKVEALDAELARARAAGGDRQRLEADLRDTRARVEQLEGSLADGHREPGGETPASGAVEDMRQRVEALTGELARISEAAPGGDVEELRARLAALESTTPQAPAELSELAERTTARFEQLEQEVANAAAATDLSAALDETRARVEELASALAAQAAERDAAERGGQDASPAELAEALARSEQWERLRLELDETRTKLDSIAGERIEEHRVLAGDLADTHAKLNALVRSVTDERQRAEEARSQLGELRQELVQLRSAGTHANGDGAALSPDAVAAVERLTAQAEQAADAARTHSATAAGAATEAEARATHAEQAAGAAEAQAMRAADSVSTVEERVAHAQQALGGIETELSSAREAAGAVSARAADVERAVAEAKGNATRAEEAVTAAQASAERAEQAAGDIEAQAARAVEAATAATAEVERVLQAASGQEAVAERAEQAAARAQTAIERGDELAGRIERDIERAEAAKKTVERSIERAEETAAGVQRDAARVEAAANQTQAAAQRSAEVAGEVEAKVARVDDRAAAVERQAERAEAAVTAAERHLMRAHDSAVSAGQHASRAGDQAGSIDEQARKLADAAATAEREAERAREAAEQAEKAAGAARQAADEADATAHGHREHEEVRVISRFRPHGPEGAPGENGGGNGVAPAPEPVLKPRQPLFAKKEEAPQRDPLPGFDDVKEPKARIALDGRFQELNQSFTDLLGYTEAEFQQAVWPPVMDRANLDKHRQQMKDMLAGNTDSVDVKTGYVHAQGLLVPVVGTLTLVRENGEPSHFLLETSAP
jgi:PAS domain S-box-containing protein